MKPDFDQSDQSNDNETASDDKRSTSSLELLKDRLRWLDERLLPGIPNWSLLNVVVTLLVSGSLLFNSLTISTGASDPGSLEASSEAQDLSNQKRLLLTQKTSKQSNSASEKKSDAQNSQDSVDSAFADKIQDIKDSISALNNELNDEISELGQSQNSSNNLDQRFEGIVNSLQRLKAEISELKSRKTQGIPSGLIERINNIRQTQSSFVDMINNYKSKTKDRLQNLRDEVNKLADSNMEKKEANSKINSRNATENVETSSSSSSESSDPLLMALKKHSKLEQKKIENRNKEDRNIQNENQISSPNSRSATSDKKNISSILGSASKTSRKHAQTPIKREKSTRLQTSSRGTATTSSSQNVLPDWRLIAISNQQAMVRSPNGQSHVVKRNSRLGNHRVLAIDSKSQVIVTDGGIIR
jgi:hypothetical protein